MLKLVLRILCIVALLAGQVGPSYAVLFMDDAGKFVADYPAEPKLTKQDGSSALGPHVLNLWEVDQGDRYWAVTYLDYPSAPALDYDRHVQGAVQGTKGTLVRQVDVQMGGLPAREAFIQTPSNYIIRQRILLLEKRLYQAIYVGAPGTETAPDIDKFMESFRLLR